MLACLVRRRVAALKFFFVERECCIMPDCLKPVQVSKDWCGPRPACGTQTHDTPTVL